MAPRHAIDGVRYRPRSERDLHISSGDWIDSTAGEVLRQAAGRKPDKVAVVGHDSDLTFRELDRASESVAAGLIGTGLRPGDRAVFQLGTVTEFFTSLYACFKAGIVLSNKDRSPSSVFGGKNSKEITGRWSAR